MCKIDLFKDFRRLKKKVGQTQTIFRNDSGIFKFRSLEKRVIVDLNRKGKGWKMSL